MAVAVAEFGDVGIDQPNLAVLHLGIRFGDRTLAETQRLHLGPGEHDPRLVHILEKILIPRTPVLGDDLGLVEGGGFGTGHWGSGLG